MKASETKIGEVMRVIDSTNTNQLLIHTTNGFIDLENSDKSIIPECNLLVELLPENRQTNLSVLYLIRELLTH